MFSYSHGAGKDFLKNKEVQLIEQGTLLVVEEGYMKSWWVFAYNNKLYKIDEYQYVDDTTNKNFEQSKFQINNNYQEVIK